MDLLGPPRGAGSGRLAAYAVTCRPGALNARRPASYCGAAHLEVSAASASRMLVFLMPADVRRSFMMPFPGWMSGLPEGAALSVAGC